MSHDRDTPCVDTHSDDPARVRALFPALSGDTVFFDNAGGSQVPGLVADAIHAYLVESYVQLGADYALSRQASAVVKRAHDVVAALMNAGVGDDEVGKVILGGSTSELVNRLAQAYAEVWEPGDEVIVSEAGHESNIGPFLRLAEGRGLRASGLVVRTWAVDPISGEASLEALGRLIGPRTRLIAVPHVSNILGAVLDLGPIVEMAHAVGARVLVDGVAYAPHRAIDVRASSVDWYVYSTYKVFGPHAAALYGSHAALSELTGPNHAFIPRGELPRKFELGGVNHEGAAGIVALERYLAALVDTRGDTHDARGDTQDDVRGDTQVDARGDGHGDKRPLDRGLVTAAFERITRLELPLQARLLEDLARRPEVRVLGPTTSGRERVGVVSFVHATRSSAEIARAANARGLGIRFGHFYAYRLCKALGLDPDDGVVRVSFAHYNKLAEVERLIAFFDEVL